MEKNSTALRQILWALYISSGGGEGEGGKCFAAMRLLLSIVNTEHTKSDKEGQDLSIKGYLFSSHCFKNNSMGIRVLWFLNFFEKIEKNNADMDVT